MDKYCATSDVKYTGVDSQPPPCARLTSDALPEAQSQVMANSSDTGVSTRYALQKTQLLDQKHWYALRTTYGREKKAYDYLIAHNIEAFLPTIKNVKLVDGKRITKEESRIPNIFFAYGTEEEIKSFVYDNVNLPFLRFYYSQKHVDNRIVKVPLVVPESQMRSFKIICAVDSDEIVVATEEVKKFKEGQKVRIIEGKFKGVVGVVARYHSQQRVGIVIDGLLTICTAYIPSAFIEVYI